MYFIIPLQSFIFYQISDFYFPLLTLSKISSVQPWLLPSSVMHVSMHRGNFSIGSSSKSPKLPSSLPTTTSFQSILTMGKKSSSKSTPVVAAPAPVVENGKASKKDKKSKKVEPVVEEKKEKKEKKSKKSKKEPTPPPTESDSSDSSDSSDDSSDDEEEVSF